MRGTHLRAALVAAVIFVSSSVTALDASELNRVTIVNRTGYDFIYVFFSPGDSDHWGPDILGTSRTLDDGRKASFYVS